MKTKLAKPTKGTIFKYSKYLLVITLLAFIRAIFTYVFIVPNGFAPGGVSGISSIIYNAVLPFNAHLAETVFNPGLTVFVLNIPLFIVAWVLLSHKFAISTIAVTAIYSGFMGMFSAIDFPQYMTANNDTGILVLASLAGGAGCGISLGFMLKNNTSLGGTDIIGKVIFKYNSATDTTWWIFACDCFVVVGSGALGFIGLNSSNPTEIVTAILSPMLYSFISLIATSQVAEIVHSGMQSSIVFNIISEQPKEIADKINSALGRGVTKVKGIGNYTGEEHELLICVVRKKQYNIVKNIIDKTDPKAFYYITKAREVNGNGFLPKSNS